MTTTTFLLLAHAAATLFMAGLIWFVQLVHYPLFPLASSRHFATFAAEHQRRTTWVVLPPMAVEALTACLLLLHRPAPPTWAGFILLALVWLSTALVQVPLHRRLASGFDAGTAARLVATNWLRTAAWTARAGVALALLHDAPGN